MQKPWWFSKKRKSIKKIKNKTKCNFPAANSQYFFVKISGIDPSVIRINWYGLNYMVFMLKKGVKMHTGASCINKWKTQEFWYIPQSTADYQYQGGGGGGNWPPPPHPLCPVRVRLNKWFEPCYCQICYLLLFREF